MAYPFKLVNPAKTLTELYDLETREAATVARPLVGTYTTGSGASLSMGASSTLQGKAFVSDSIEFSATEQILVQWSVGGYSGNTTFPQFAAASGNTWVGPGQSMAFPLKRIIRFNQVGLVALVNNLLKPSVASGTAVPFLGYVTLHGSYLTDDINPGADLIMNVIGDSIPWGSGLTLNSDMYPFQVQDAFLAKGNNMRFRNFSISGSTLSQHAALAKNRGYTYKEPGITFIALGMNDSIQGVATATSMAALQQIITYRNYYNPLEKIVVVPPSPALNTTTESRNANLRSAMLGASYPTNVSVVTGMDTVLSTSTDLQADGVHPLASGHAKIASNIITFMNGLSATAANYPYSFVGY